VGSYRLAPEWARQDAVILVWPHSNSDWNSQLNAIEHAYIELSQYIARKQKLILVAYDQAHVNHIQITLNHCDINFENIQFIDIPTNDTWVRDFGPVFVESDGETILLDFVFDAWGNKYNHDNDNLFNKLFKQQLNICSKRKNINIIIEAGNLEINSKGNLLSSSDCFKRQAAKQQISLASLEINFEDWFGCTQVLWIKDVKLIGDDTDGHIDTLARYCTDDVVTYSASENHSNPDHDALDSLKNQLNRIKNKHSCISEIVPLPLPKPIIDEGKQLPATYANFLITNAHVFVPVFNDPQDNYALKTIDELFPTREIIEIESNTLIKQFGGIHCAAMHIPQGALK